MMMMGEGFRDGGGVSIDDNRGWGFYLGHTVKQPSPLHLPSPFPPKSGMTSLNLYL